MDNNLTLDKLREKWEKQRQKNARRYLPADKVTLPANPPQFVEVGHCQWCNKELTGRVKRFCQAVVEEWYPGHFRKISHCSIGFHFYWYGRPAYVRATLIKDDFTCQNCGARPMREDKPWLPDISQLEADHIIPVAKGGKTEMANLQTLCMACNRRKGTKSAAKRCSQTVMRLE